MAEITIPKEHQSKFLAFITLPDAIKQKIFDNLKSAQKTLSPRYLIEHLSSSISEIEESKILDVVVIYLNLMTAKNNFGVSQDAFIPILEKALLNTKIPELVPNEKILTDFSRLLSSNDSFSVLTAMTENQKTFSDAKIYQDVRPIFDDTGELIGSTIIHNLKLIFKENGENKEIYLALDNDDVDKIAEKIKTAQKNAQLINKKFTSAKIIK